MVTNKERIQAHNAELREAIEMAENLPNAGGVAEPIIKPLEVTENGTYTAPDGVDGYSPVTVNVPIPDGYIVPSGTKTITENGTHDAKAYESVNVNVPIPDGYIVPSGSQEITANGSYDVTDKAGVVVAVPEREIVLQDKEITANGIYSADDSYDGLGEVNVNVPIPDGYIQPSGELEVTENGTHDVTAYASVKVSVEASGDGSDDMAGALADRTITNFSSNSCAAIGEYSFRGCASLATLVAPNAKSVGTYALYGCNKLKSIALPSVTSLATNAFREASNLEVIDFSKLATMPSNAFYGCRGLKALILRSETMVTLSSTNAFYQCYRILGTKNSGYNPNGEKIGFIYVKTVENYKVATNWSDDTLVTQLRPIVATVADLVSIDGSVYNRAFAEDENCVYIYDGSAWAKEA